MRIVGSVESLWRYPVKSMQGEELEAIFAGFPGVYGDRLFAFRSSANRSGFPYFTLREQSQMLRYRPRFRQPEKAVAPPNLAAAQSIASGATPVYGDPVDLMVDVETPAGKTMAIDDPALVELLLEGIDEKHRLTLLRSDRALTDCRPLSLLAVQTAGKLAHESGVPIDKRRFRANIYLDLTNSEGFTEDTFVGQSLRIGSKVTLAVLQRDSRCMITTLDPDTGEKAPAVLKTVAQAHGGMAGIYAAVMVEGMVEKGDPVALVG